MRDNQEALVSDGDFSDFSADEARQPAADFSETERGYHTQEGVPIQCEDDAEEEVDNTPLGQLYQYVEKKYSREPTVAETRYKFAKYAGIAFVDLLSLALYTKVSFSLAGCDIGADNVGCDKITLSLALFGNNVANFVVGFNTGRLGVEYFEARRIPKEIEHLFSDFKEDWSESLKTIGIVAVSVVASFPMAAPIMLGLASSGKTLTIFELIATLVSNSFFDILPTYLIVEQILKSPLMLAAFCLLLPVISVPVGLLVAVPYKVYQQKMTTVNDRILKELKGVRDRFFEAKRARYVKDLENCVLLVSDEMFKGQGARRKLFPGFIFFPQELKVLTPKKVEAYLNSAKASDQQVLSPTYIKVRGAIQNAIVTGTVFGLGGYYYDTIVAGAGLLLTGCLNPEVAQNNTNCTGYLNANYTMEAQTLANMNGVQWFLDSQLVLPSLLIFGATVIYFGSGVGKQLVDVSTLKFESVQGFKMRPKLAIAVTLMGAVICYFSGATAVSLMMTLNSSISSWAGQGPFVNFLTGFLLSMAKYVTPTNNLASWMTTTNSLFLEFSKRAGGSSRDFVIFIEKVRELSERIPLMNLKGFYQSLPKGQYRWVEDSELANMSLNEMKALYPDEFAEQPKKPKSGRCCGLFRARKEMTEKTPLLLNQDSSAAESKSWGCGIM